MRTPNFWRLAILAFCACLSGNAFADDGAKSDARRAEIRQTAVATLEQLYFVQPKARLAIDEAAGYAVFSNFGMKIGVAGGGSGRGIVVDRASGRETFMKMAEVQAGLGLRVKKYRQVWLFERRADLQRFIDSGWEMSGQSTASAQLAGRGGELHSGALSLRSGVWLYQLSDSGLALDITAKGTRYYRDKKLN